MERVETVREEENNEKKNEVALEKSESHPGGSRSLSVNLLVLSIIFITALSTLLMVYKSLPKFDSEERKAFKLPTSLEDAKLLGRVLSKYKESHFYPVVFSYFMTYVFLQSFAIPGSIFLSIMSGFLFDFRLALLLICSATAIGSTICYLLCNFFGKALIWKLFPERALEWSDKVQKHRSNLLNYIIFLRITPIIPNWFINLASPIINVPIPPFFLGTFLGVAPPSFVAIQAGTTLQELTSTSNFSVRTVIILGLLATLSILPIVFKSKLRQKFD